MSKKNLIYSLFLAIVCLGTFKAADALSRPDSMPVSTWKEGCYPFVKYQCPAGAFCFIDFDYPKFGRCIARLDRSYRQKPPEDPGAGNELARLPDYTDYTFLGPNNIFTSLVFLAYSLYLLHFLIAGVLLFYRVKKQGGKMLSTSTFALILFICYIFGEMIRQYIFFASRSQLDTKWVFSDVFYGFTDWCVNQFMTWFWCECMITWLDLYQKTVNLSKRSTKLIGVFRWIIRIYAMAQAVSVTLASLPGTQFTVASDFFKIVQQITRWIQVSLGCSIAPLISRILCKDMKDVTNPNWKAASAIRFTAAYHVVTNILFHLGMEFFYMTGLYTHQALYMTEFTWEFMFGVSFACSWGWWKYLLFAHRRYLKDNAATSISAYYGMSSLANGRSRASTIASGKSSTASSVASSASSVAATSSAEDDGKGTLA
mmetsp:Transcript_26714/g.30580  ORF Transcript_26714/g.30580 Transcript_26714/m.30580 type:complete len:428 (+) Transcript_26714:758-2041(+)